MIRTLISLEPKDKEWLKRYGEEHHQSLSETIRQSIRLFIETKPRCWNEILARTAGSWPHLKEDGVEFERRIRSDWDDRA